MEITSQEDSLNHQVTMIIKGKRTKRQRTDLSPLRLTIGGGSNSSSSFPTAGGGGGDHRGSDLQEWVATTPTTSINESTTTEEEEEMANCLILLAQGRNHDHFRRPLTAAPPVNYQCKTCDRTFHSFQALGGHRASHKKPKSNKHDDHHHHHHHHQDQKINNNKLFAFVQSEDHHDNKNDVITPGKITNLSLRLANGIDHKRNHKVHECSICGAEFSSGQALGGHMRRHRASTTAINGGISNPAELTQSKRPRNILQVDLNLPAPEDHDHDR